MSHRPGNKDCPLHPDGPKIISFDKPECTCKPTTADRLAEIAQHLDAMERMNGEDGCLEEAQSFAEDAQLVRNVAKDLRELEQVKTLLRLVEADYEDGFEEKVLFCPTLTTDEWMEQRDKALQGSNKE